VNKKITVPSGTGQNGSRRWVRVTHDMHRKRAGAAYLRLAAGCVEVAEAIGLKNHSGASRRRVGDDGPLAPLLIEVDAMERAGIDSTPILDALIDTQLRARGETGECPRKMAVVEQAADNAEESAQVAYLTGTGTAADWRRSLVAYVATALQTIRALGGVA
jgi:hypothetical protein